MDSNNKVYFKQIQKVICSYIDNADYEILIAVAWITDDYILERLLLSLKKGIDVYIVFYSDNINDKNKFKKLFESGANIRHTTKLMHNKFCVIDKTTTINGSYNWTNNAKKNDENIQVTENSKNIVDTYVTEFFRIFDNSKSINDFFKTEIQKFNEFKNEINEPKKYPFFVKINFKFYNLKTFRNGKENDKIYYVFIKEKYDFDYLIDLLFNIRNNYTDYRFKDFNLNFFDEIYNTKAFNYIEVFDQIFFDFENLSEVEFFVKKSYLKLSEISYAGINRIPLLELYSILLSHKDKIPQEITTIEKLKSYVISLIPNLGFKSKQEISEEIILNKIYFGIPLNIELNIIPDYSLKNFYSFEFYDFEKNNCLVSKKLIRYDNIKKINYFNIDKNGNVISEILTYSSYDVYLHNLKSKSNKESEVLTFHNDYIITYEEFNYTEKYNKYTSRRIYGLSDINGKVIFPPIFDYISKENKDFIFFECIPIFYIMENTLISTHISLKEENDILNFEKNRVLRFKFDKKHNKLIQISFSNNKLDYYLTDSNYLYSNYYKALLKYQNGYKSNQFIVFFRDYLVANNLINLSPDKIEEIYISKSKENYNKNNKNCYIATLVYEDINHYKVDFLRKFRDQYLMNNSLGKLFIKNYYIYSPNLVIVLKNKNKINYLIKSILNIFIYLLSKLIKIQ